MKIMMLLSMMSMCWWRNHIIMMLLSLELLLLTTFMLINQHSNLSFSFINLIFLTMMIAASSFGLSILVIMSRSHKSSMANPITNLMYNNTYSNKLLN